MSRKKKTTPGKGSRSAAPPAPARTAEPATREAGSSRPRGRGAWIAGVAVLAVVIAAGVAYWAQRDRAPITAAPVVVADARYVGGAECASCHASQQAAWHGSDHDLAMQVADEKSVLGNFADAKFTYAGTTSTFSRRDGKHFVNTDGPDGKLADYEIKYTFGVHPLQQYLIEFPGGRMQALSIAWDSRPKTQGGQRWFHLYPGQNIKAGDWLHWTSRRPELELHVRRMPFDQPAQGLRRRRERVQDDVVGIERRVRGVPWTRVESCGLGAQAGRLAGACRDQGTRARAG